MEFFHKVTRFPFMNTRKVWYGLSAVLIVASFALVAVRGLNLASTSPAAWWSRPISRSRPTSSNCAPPSRRRDFRGAGSGLRQLPRHPGASAAGSEREGRGDRRAHPGRFQERGCGRETAAHGGGRAAGRTGAVREGRACAGGHAGADRGLRAVALHLETCAGCNPRGVARSDLRRGFFAVSQITFDLTAISAILAVIGYSLNDTVIVFDRVRERARHARKLPVSQVIDESSTRPVANPDDQARHPAGGGVPAVFGGERCTDSPRPGDRHHRGNVFSIYISAALALDFGLRTDDLLEHKHNRPEKSTDFRRGSPTARRRAAVCVDRRRS